MDNFERETMMAVLAKLEAKFESEEAYEKAIVNLRECFAIYGEGIVSSLMDQMRGLTNVDPRSLN